MIAITFRALLGSLIFSTLFSTALNAAPPAAEEEEQSLFTWGMQWIHQDITTPDLRQLRRTGITVVSGEWGMNQQGSHKILYVLNQVAECDLQLIVNLADAAAWGYKYDGTDDQNQPPVWQKDRVADYLEEIRHHPGIFGYKIANSAGANLPNGDRFRITADQLKQAAADVRAIDSERPIIVEVNWWTEEDEKQPDFAANNPIVPGVADVIILCLYSNYSKDGKEVLQPRLVRSSGQQLVDKISTASPKSEIWVSLAAFRQGPHFLMPSPEDLDRDIVDAGKLCGVSNISLFGWGSHSYVIDGKPWYLPVHGDKLWHVICVQTEQTPHVKSR